MEFQDLSPQLLINILLDLPIDQIKQLCSLKSKLNKKICRNPDFWELKYQRDTSLYNVLFMDFGNHPEVRTLQARNEEEAFKKFIHDKNVNIATEMLESFGRYHNFKLVHKNSKTLYFELGQIIQDEIEAAGDDYINYTVEPGSPKERWLKDNEEDLIYFLTHIRKFNIGKAKDGDFVNLID